MEENAAEARRGGGGASSHAQGVAVGAAVGDGLEDGAGVEAHTPASHWRVAQSEPSVQALPPPHPRQKGPPQSTDGQRKEEANLRVLTELGAVEWGVV